MKIKVYALQFTRELNYNKTLEKAKNLLKEAESPDFALIGGEFSVNESINTNPYPALTDLATTFNCNIVAPVNANVNRFPNSKQKGFSSMHVFNRKGKVVAIQDKYHFYWKERPWFRQGKEVKVFEIEGIKIGLMRGLDVLYPDYSQQLKEAEVIFYSTMAIDNMMLDLAKTRTLENQCYFIMSSFIGPYVGMTFIGNAAILESNFVITKGMRIVNQTKVLQYTTGEGIIQGELDIDYIRKIKREYPLNEL